MGKVPRNRRHRARIGSTRRLGVREPRVGELPLVAIVESLHASGRQQRQRQLGQLSEYPVNDWAVSDVLNLNLVSGNGSGSTCSPTSGRIEVCNGAYGNNGWLGIAQIWTTQGSHITQATTKVNDTYFASAPYNTSAWKQMVMCQEVGHDFGLDHQDENFNNPNLGTCMDYTNDPSTNQHPNAHDYEELDIIYKSHLDGSSGGGKPCNPHKPNCQGSAGSAPPFSQASRANGDVYVDQLPNGGRRITHVFWAPLG